MKKNNLIRKVKQTTAGLLTAAMVLTGAPLGSMSAMASTLPANADLLPTSPPAYPAIGHTDYSDIPVTRVGNYTFGNSNTTAYAFGPVQSATNSYSGFNSFNIGAITDTNSAKNNTKGYLSGNGDAYTSGLLSTAAVKSGWSTNWWNTYYAFGSETQVTPSSVTYESDNITPNTAGAPAVSKTPFKPVGNGTVTEIAVPGSTTDKIEVRMEVKPSDDNQTVLVKYTVYNPTGSHVDFWIGNESDTQVYHTDGCHIIVNEGQTHLHMMDILRDHGLTGRGAEGSANNDKYGLADFDVRVAGGTNIDNRVWAGEYPSTANIGHTNWVFAKNAKDNIFMQGIDSAAAWSSHFSLDSHEMQYSSFTISMRPAVYYVDPEYRGTDSCGYITLPYKSVKDAVDAMRTKGVNKGYIFLVHDDIVTQKIDIPANLDVQIASSPYKDLSGLPIAGTGRLAGNNYIDLGAENIDPTSTAVHSIKRGGDLAPTDPIFNVNQPGSKLQFYNVTVDGDSKDAKAPLIDVTNGEVVLNAGTTIQNAKAIEANVASAISVGSAGTLSLNGQGGTVEIKNNSSTENGSAVIIKDDASNDHPVTINGDVQATTNTNAVGKANVDIGKKGLWVKKGDTFEGKINVNTTNTPNSDDQATPIVDFAERNVAGATVPYSTSNFGNDTIGQSIDDADVSNRETAAAGVTPTAQVSGRLYLNAAFKTITISYVDENGSNIGINPAGGTDPNKFAHGTVNPVTIQKAVGSKVGEDANNGIVNAPTLAGYMINSVRFSPDYAETGKSTGTGTNVVNGTIESVMTTGTPAKPTGNIGGKVYSTDVDITVEYIKAGKTYKFDAQGGGAVTDRYESISATATTSTLGTLPRPVKLGYDFVKWVKYNDVNNNNVYDAGDTVIGDMGTDATPFPVPNGNPETIKMYAVWTPGSTTYDVRRNYINSNPSLSLNLGSDVDSYQITHVVDHDPATIPGYKYVSGTKTPLSIGTLDTNPAPVANAGHLHIDSMPALNVTTNYKYVVDTSQTFTFTVKYVDAAGNDIGSAPAPSQKRAEQAINAQKQNISGYTYNNMTIDAGYNSNITHYIVGLDVPALLTTNDSTNGVFAGHMPNQNVTVTFHYNVDAGMNLVRRYLDHERNDSMITSKVNGPYTPGDTLNASDFTFAITDELYGYVYGTHTLDNLDPAGSGSVAVDGSGNITGNMPSAGNGVIVKYLLNHDANKWRTINFAVASTPNNNGSVDALPAGAPTSFLANDGTTAGSAHAYTFDKLKNDGYVPSVTPNRYYKFDGWYLDAAATQQVNGTATFPTGTTPITLYAKFVEDPSQWFDINFAAGSNGSISAPATLHVPYDYTWNQIASQLPTATPVANYIFNGWKDPNGTPMQATSTLTNHATYTAIFSQDPNTWGTNTGNITPTGRIGNDGSGEIVIDGTTPGNVYVISDPNGNIVAVVPGDSVGNRTVVPNLIPGAHYNVQEGTPDTVATVGQPISSITGTSVSTPQDVYVPTVDSNYNIGYDPDNDGMAQIVINPADPDADYALIDENGNVVPYPGSDNGWMTPVGNNPSTVTFNNLNPNETYTVVARKKGDSSIPNPLTKLPDGNQIIANPGDMADAPKYVVETKDGSVVSVGTTSVGNDTYDHAKAGEAVTIHADPVNANGKNFLYWQVLAGRAVGVSGNITQADYTFTLSNSNIVLKAVYEPTKIAGDDADLTETIRGGSAGEFGLDPNQIPGLANTLTTPLDRSLNSVNGANIEYKVVFNKRDAKTNEKTAVKPVSISGIDHPDAHTAAYGLDIQLERYVNGRLVNNGIVATASNATVDVIAQLPAEDVDQLDYQLYDVTPDNAGNITPVEVTITTDVANNAGLLKFTGNLQHSYVLVYSKTFKVTFIDNKPVLDNLHLNDTSRNFYKKFKVRRKENVEDSYYSSDYAAVTAYAQNDVANALVTPFEDIYGVQYDYKNWSKKEDKLSVYDTTSPVTKRMVIYAYYSDNRKEVAKARLDLGDTIDIAKDLTGDPYLKAGEVAEINEAIAHALETLRQARDLVAPDGTTYLRQANWAELQQAIDALRAIINKYSKGASDREAARIKRTGGASGGGNSSSGRGSKLLTPGEKSQQSTARNEGSNVRAFVLGVDGAWEKNPVTKGWSFVLNGGTPINDMWGMITFNDNTGKKVSRWYYFDGQSTMATGWVYDSKNGNWYYMNTNEGPDLGQMVTGWVKDPKTSKWYYMNDNTGILKTGWHKDPQDGRWYYLNSNGEMLTGWQNIGGKWYYFNTNTPENTYAWDAAAFKWNYLNNNVRPYGSMYAGEKTPDGYTVDANGAWN